MNCNKSIRYTLAASLISLIPSIAGNAQTADFEDLVVNDSYVSGDTFSSNGIMFTVGDFTFSGGGIGSGSALVINPNSAGPGNAHRKGDGFRNTHFLPLFLFLI